MNLLKNWNKPSKRDTPFLFVGGGSCRIIFNFRSLTLTPSFDTLNPKYSISSMANSVLLGLADKEFSRNLQNCFHIFQISSLPLRRPPHRLRRPYTWQPSPSWFSAQKRVPKCVTLRMDYKIDQTV